MLKYLLAFLLVFGFSALVCTGAINRVETQFLWEVKQINEFIERFNNYDSTLLKQYYKKESSQSMPTREGMIKRLFNAQGKGWNLDDVKTFIALASDKNNPRYLDFYGDNWTANVSCAVFGKAKRKRFADFAAAACAKRPGLQVGGYQCRSPLFKNIGRQQTRGQFAV